VKITIVGGGVIGLTCAWYLARMGESVSIVERGDVGQGASSGNTGWLVPALAAPLAAPGTIRRSLRLALKRDSPVSISPPLSVSAQRWLWRFYRSAQPASYAPATMSLARLSSSVFQLYDELRDGGVQFEMHDDGVTMLFLTQEAAEDEFRHLTETAGDGSPGATLISGDEVRRNEPLIGDAVAAAVELHGQGHLRPESLIAGLTQSLRDLGVRISERCAVTRIVSRRGGWLMDTDGETVESEKVILAAGWQTAKLVEGLGGRITLQPGLGYTLTSEAAHTAPAKPLYFGEGRISCAPYADSTVRLASFLGLGSSDSTIDRRRVETIVKAADRYAPDLNVTSRWTSWTGVRPMTADGLPYIGSVPGREGLFVATGHGMLGMTLAPATGEALARAVVEYPRELPELSAFRLDRG